MHGPHEKTQQSYKSLIQLSASTCPGGRCQCVSQRSSSKLGADLLREGRQAAQVANDAQALRQLDGAPQLCQQRLPSQTSALAAATQLHLGHMLKAVLCWMRARGSACNSPSCMARLEPSCLCAMHTCRRPSAMASACATSMRTTGRSECENASLLTNACLHKG